MPKFRKGELNFYKTCTPVELQKHYKDNVEDQKFVTHFLNCYDYNYVSKKWSKIHKTLLDKVTGN